MSAWINFFFKRLRSFRNYMKLKFYKARLARLEGISTNQQHIIFSGKLLDNESILKDIGVANHSKLRLVTQMRGGPVNTRFVTFSKLQTFVDFW